MMTWEGSWKAQATVDHMLARGFGGSDEVENYELLCGRCNNKKSRIECALMLNNSIDNSGT